MSPFGCHQIIPATCHCVVSRQGQTITEALRSWGSLERRIASLAKVGESSLEFLVFHKRTRWLEWATARHLAQGEGPGKVCIAKPTRVGARSVLSIHLRRGSRLTLCILFHLFIAPSRFTLFDFGVCSHECTERRWRSKSVSFSIVFHLFLWNRLSLSLVFEDWLTD